MINKRSQARTIRCNWCFKIHSDGRWFKERRRKAPDDYVNVVCRKCKVFFFGDPDIEQTIQEIKDWQA